VTKKYQAGQVVRYIRTGAIYLLLEEVEVSMMSPHYMKGAGYGFRAFVLFTGRTWTKVSEETELFILKKSAYYEILSDLPKPGVDP